MAFLSRLFSRAQRAPLPSMEELFAERAIPMDLPGLEEFKGDFEHLEAEERRQWAEAIAELQSTGRGLPPLWLDAQFDLLPQVVPHWQAEREGFLFKPLFEGLCQRILACGKLVPRPWLIIWGVSEEDLEERALARLLELSQGKPFQRQPSGIYRSNFGDGLDASRILLPELWAELFPGQNTFIAIPAHSCLLVAPQVLLPKLVDAIGPAIGAGDQRISATIYQHVGQTILPANLQDPHPIAQPQRELRQSDLLAACVAQEQDLPAELGQPAGLLSLRTQQGRSLLMAIWKEGQPCLLPDTDLVGFIDAQDKALGIFFRQTLPRISEIRGETVDIWGPRRTRYTGFPTRAQVERLEPFATSEQMVSLLRGQGNAPRPAQPQTTAPASGTSSSPVPEHLRGLSLGPVRED
ncbi:MAG: hypothetical protein H6Q00_340 [Holophagaceae bacterium]|nr:hypothetical protein [Holophagaceae bacterium]